MSGAKKSQNTHLCGFCECRERGAREGIAENTCAVSCLGYNERDKFHRKLLFLLAKGRSMPSNLPQPAMKIDRKVPLVVIAVALYELAKAGFLAWVFWQCWEVAGSGIPPFGEVEAHSQLFAAPYFLFFALLAVFHVVVTFGLFALGNWARAACTLPLVAAIPWWVMEHVFGYSSLMLPVDTSMILAAIALEVVAVAILYTSPGVRQAFASSE
jgi:hypothetical protein